MEKGKDKKKRLEEKEKWDAEVERSLSVVKLKEAHKQIEEVEKLRKHDAILSINDRITSLSKYCTNMTSVIHDLGKDNPKEKMNEYSLGSATLKYANTALTFYQSIRLDIERNIDVGKENFDKLFPILEIDTSNFGSLCTSLVCMFYQLEDMTNYLKRLL